jgi:L-ascorbate metabolism protein UlaG (beta-lactamase superfamily)
MSPREAAVAAQLLRARKIIPMHFGTFPALTGRPEQLGKLVTDLETEVWALEPGETVEW